MTARSAPFELTLDEVRAVVGGAVYDAPMPWYALRAMGGDGPTPTDRQFDGLPSGRAAGGVR